MRIARRLAAGLAGMAALTILMTATTLAGNYAEVTIIGGGGDPPTAGEEREIRFSLLQHGVTPVDFGSVQLTATLPGGGEPIVVDATSIGGGEWVATVTFPVEGDWQMRITHSVFETPEARTFAVGPSAAMTWVPVTLALTGAAALAILLVTATLLIGRSRPQAAAEPSATVVRAG